MNLPTSISVLISETFLNQYSEKIFPRLYPSFRSVRRCLRNKMVALTCVPTDLYDHVYGFLVENGLLKTAKKFKNEVSQEVKQPSGPGLVEIFSTFFNSVQPGILKEAETDNENDNLKSNTSNENTNNVNIGAVKKSKKNKKRKQDEEINLTDAKKAKKGQET